jgi:HlyD family secretion protein
MIKKLICCRGLLAGRAYLRLVAVALLAIGSWWFFRASGGGPHYQTARVDKGSVQASITATGNTNAVVTVQVGSQVSGNIKELHADFNTKVTKGQLVALIDPEPFQARVDQARAALDNAKAAVVSAQAGIAKSDADIASAQATVANQRAAILKAKAAIVDAKTKATANQALFDSGIISNEDMVTAQSNYDQAVAEEQAAEAQLDAAEHQVQSAQAQKQIVVTQLAAAQAQVQQFSAALAQVQIDLDHTRITAPVDGTVVSRNMDVGQTVAASFQSPTIFLIAQDLTKMQVDTNVDEADVGEVRLGQAATFTVDAYPSTTFQGRVAQIREAPINVQNVVTYDIVVAVSNKDLKLFPGMTASVKILTDEENNVLKVPNTALRYRPANMTASGAVHAAGRPKPGEQTIWVLDQNGTPRPETIKLGISDGNFTAVESGGLRPGDQVILSATSKNPAAAGTSGTPRMRGPGF